MVTDRGRKNARLEARLRRLNAGLRVIDAASVRNAAKATAPDGQTRNTPCFQAAAAMIARC